MKKLLIFLCIVLPGKSQAAIVINSAQQRVYAEANGMNVTVLDWTSSGEWYGFQYGSISDQDQSSWAGTAPLGSINISVAAIGTDDVDLYPDLAGMSSPSSQASATVGQALEYYSGPSQTGVSVEEFAFDLRFSSEAAVTGAGDASVVSSNEMTITFTLTEPAYYTLSAGSYALGWDAAALEDLPDYTNLYTSPSGVLPAGQYQLVAFDGPLAERDYVMSFSLTSIPEASTFTLGCIALSALLLVRRRNQRNHLETTRRRTRRHS